MAVIGHHGLFCHTPDRKKIYGAILCSNSAIHEEARAVLYGENVFYLGPMNHKPTYSASLPTAIGVQNTAFIKKVIFHSTHLADLDPSFIHTWLSKQGINPSALRVIAISQSSPTKDPVADIPTHATQTLPTQGTPQFTWHFQPQHSNAVYAHGWSSVQQCENKVREFLEEVTEDLDGYFDIMRTEQVEKLVAVKNSDLRAGGLWLVHVSDDIRQRAGAAVLVGEDQEECRSKELLSRQEIMESKNKDFLSRKEIRRGKSRAVLID